MDSSRQFDDIVGRNFSPQEQHVAEEHAWLHQMHSILLKSGPPAIAMMHKFIDEEEPNLSEEDATRRYHEVDRLTSGHFNLYDEYERSMENAKENEGLYHQGKPLVSYCGTGYHCNYCDKHMALPADEEFQGNIGETWKPCERG